MILLHSSEVERDAARVEALQHAGYRVFRVRNIDIYENPEGVLDSLVAFIESLWPPLTPTLSPR